MERMSICRICLVENVRMYIVIEKHLHELYEKLTDIPFVTEDRRPMLACFFCFAKLKQCCQLQRKCLEAEELFAQMMNEPSPSVNRSQLQYSAGLTISPVENISIAGRERLDDVIEPEEEHQSDDVGQEKVEISYSDEDAPTLHWSESDSEVYETFLPLKTEPEKELEVLRKTRRASDTTRAAVATKQKQPIRRKILEDVITENQKKNEESITKVTQNTQHNTSKLIPKFHKLFTDKLPRVNISLIDIALDTNCNNNKKGNLTKRTHIRTGEAPYKCDICQYSCNYKGGLIKHIRVHTGEKPFKCNVCRSSFSKKHHLSRHMRTHTGEKPYKCEECQLSFSEKGYLTKHIRRHTGEKPYKCKECQLSFSQQSILTCHIRTHTGAKPYKCEECHLCFSHKSTLKNHIRTHTGEKPYKCEECQLCFTQKTILTKHILTHTGIKPYKCEECKLCFSRKNHLTEHMRKHTGEKPYTCNECGLCFRLKSYLRQHILTHTGKKLYKCEECQLCFTRKGHLTNHIRTHTGEKPYKCKECDYMFSRKGSLTKHIRRRHPVENKYK